MEPCKKLGACCECESRDGCAMYAVGRVWRNGRWYTPLTQEQVDARRAASRASYAEAMAGFKAQLQPLVLVDRSLEAAGRQNRALFAQSHTDALAKIAAYEAAMRVTEQCAGWPG